MNRWQLAATMVIAVAAVCHMALVFWVWRRIDTWLGGLFR
jgi:HAMP domain-containing protein